MSRTITPPHVRHNADFPCYNSRMNEHNRKQLLRLYVIATCISFLALLVLCGAEAYIRWTLNQTFTFLGTDGIALGVLVAAQFIGLALILRSRD